MEKQKLKEKSNVGALSVRNTKKNLPNCAQKENKGITLVALIITIIVLLILAVVAIRAVQEDGIIGHAKNAKSATTVAQEQEQIQLATNEWQIQKNYPTNSYAGFYEFMLEKLSGVASSVSKIDDVTLTVTMQDTGNIYTVKEDGTIIGPIENGNGGGSNPGPSTEDLDYIETYFMGAKDETTGERLKNINITTLFTDMDKMTFSDTNIKFGGIPDRNYTEMYVRYNQTPYKIIFDGSSYVTTDVTELTTKGREGQYVSYNGETWIILYDDDTNGLQMISAKSLNYNDTSFNLGNNDSLINWDSLTENLKTWKDEQKREVDFDGDEELNDFEKSVYSYNKAITTLNKACESFVKAEDMKTESNPTGKITSVRCVGSNPTNKESENATPYESDNLKIWPIANENFEVGIGNKKGKSTDTNYETDLGQMKNLAILSTDSPSEYWLASRFVNAESGNVGFQMRILDGIGAVSYYVLCGVNESFAYGNSFSKPLRPVVTLKSDIQFSGSGTAESPYTF